MSTPIEEKKEGKILGNYGDVKGFFKDVLRYIVYVILWGLGGAFVMNLITSPSSNIKRPTSDINDNNSTWTKSGIVENILPTHKDKAPYSGGKTPLTVDDVFKEEGDRGFALHKVLEYMYPMESVSFPYESWLLHEKNVGPYISTLAKSFSNTCGYVFRLFRGWYKTFIVTMYGFLLLSPVVGEIILFYFLPFLLIAFHAAPILVIVGFFASFVGSVVENVEGAKYLAIPPVGAILYAIVMIFGGQMSELNPLSYILGIGAWFLSFGVMTLQWWWYFFIGIALWLYGIMFILFSPIAQYKGFERITESIQKHWKGLATIFLLFVFKAGNDKLNSSLSNGIIVGIFLSLFMIYKA